MTFVRRGPGGLFFRMMPKSGKWVLGVRVQQMSGSQQTNSAAQQRILAGLTELLAQCGGAGAPGLQQAAHRCLLPAGQPYEGGHNSANLEAPVVVSDATPNRW